MKAFRPVPSVEKNLNRTVQAAKESFQSLQNVPHNNGTLLRDVQLFADRTNKVKHGLGRRVEGMTVYLKSANADIWQDQTDNQDPATYIYIQCSSDVIANIWVF